MIGILLVNLGTPDSPQTKDVRRYLREFLSDPRVIDIASLPRWALVNLIIAPFRSPKSAKSYAKIWTQQGSPLLFNSLELVQQVQAKLGDNYRVELGMRYGKPSIASAMDKLKSQRCSEIRALLLYPQYASSSTGSSEAAILAYLKKQNDFPEVKFLPPFFDHPGFLKSFAKLGQERLTEFKPDHTLFSFHGLPERQILKGDHGGKHCLQSPDCCETMIPANGMCYRAHCFQSAHGIAKELNLSPDDYSICFQSRLGRTPWIQPFTDVVIQSYAQQGLKRLAVFCPSFVADCLETLEEIGMRARTDFKAAGGEDLLLIPSLNSEPHWVETVSNMVRG